MRHLFSILLTLLLLPTFSAFGQITPRDYSATHDLSNSLIKYHLELKTDGTFYFHFYRKNICDSCEEENQYGKGSWRLEKNNLILTTDSDLDLDEKYELNLNASKARLIKKRDSKEGILKFYASDIFWVKGMELTR